MHCLIGLMLFVVSTSPGWRLEHVSSAFATMFDVMAPVLLCDTLFVATNGFGVGCYDISDPAVPKLFSYVSTPGSHHELKLRDQYCYVADGYAGFAVIDLADPGSPREVGRCAVPTPYLRCLTVKGDFAYAVGCPGDFYVIDVSDPSSPHLIASLPISECCMDCEVLGDFAYVCHVRPDWAVRVISIADPAHPVEVNRLPTQYALSLYLEDTLCFCGDESYVRIFNVADPMNITQIGVWSSLVNFYSCITRRDSILFVVGNATHPGLWMVNVADPTHPVEIGFYRRQEAMWDVLVADTIAYLTAEFGLHVVDIADMRNPIWVNWLPRDACIFPVVVPPILYVTGDLFGLKIFDIGNPRDPVLLSWTVLPDSFDLTYGLAVGDGLLYMGTMAGFRVLDVSDPSHPALIGTLDGPSVGDVNLRSAYAYVTEAYRNMAVIDVSMPTQPRLVSRYSDPRLAYYNLSLSGTLVYVAGHDFEVVDVSDPVQPRQVGYCPTPGDACGVGVKYPYAYVTDYASGLAVIDVSDPTNPQVVNQVPLPGLEAFGCMAVDSFLYVNVGLHGVKMFSLADPLNPVEVASYDTPGAHQGVGNNIAVIGDLVFVGDWGAVQILQRRFVGVREENHVEVEKRPSLSVWPSHSRGRVSISFVLQRPGKVTLGIYSVAGRLVRNMVLDALGHEYSLTWDGTDERGDDVPAGVYFCQLKAKDYSATKKFVLLR